MALPLLLRTLDHLAAHLSNTSSSAASLLTTLTELEETLQTFHQKVILDKEYNNTRGGLVSLETVMVIVAKIAIAVGDAGKEVERSGENGESRRNVVEELGHWRRNLEGVLEVLGW